ncbi:MAG: redoxin domain-containing protein [Pseudomonadota bacterium]
MNNTRTTYELASTLLRDYVQPLWPGAHALPFNLRDQDGRPLGMNDDHLAGRALLVLLINARADAEQAQQIMRAVALRCDQLADMEVAVLAVSADSDGAANRQLQNQSGFRWPILGDSTGAVFASFGVHKASDQPSRAVVLSPSRQVRAWFDLREDIEAELGAAMNECNPDSSGAGYWTTTHAPVLQVPAVLSREECAQLIRLFEQDEPLMIRPPQAGELPGNYKIPVYEHNRQDRVDQIIKDQQTLAFLDERIFGRVVPMIKKAFAYEVTRREDLHIARYVGKRSGNQMGHRDNVSAATAYRRFALSLNLNDDYDGGEVQFKEYGNQRYKSPAGSALVFSSALLHEVLETTQGTRYTLISHFFNEQSLNAK